MFCVILCFLHLVRSRLLLKQFVQTSKSDICAPVVSPQTDVADNHRRAGLSAAGTPGGSRRAGESEMDSLWLFLHSRSTEGSQRRGDACQLVSTSLTPEEDVTGI